MMPRHAPATPRLRDCEVRRVDSHPFLKNAITQGHIRQSHSDPLPPQGLMGRAPIGWPWVCLRDCAFCEFFLSPFLKIAGSAINIHGWESTRKTRRPANPKTIRIDGSFLALPLAGNSRRDLPLVAGLRAYATPAFPQEKPHDFDR